MNRFSPGWRPELVSVHMFRHYADPNIGEVAATVNS